MDNFTRDKTGKFVGKKRFTRYDEIYERVNMEFNDECWEWEGSHTADGYANLTVNYKSVHAHVLAYELRYGDVPEGLELDHEVCDNRSCWNPAHVKPKTHRENILRSSTQHPEHWGKGPRGR